MFDGMTCNEIYKECGRMVSRPGKFEGCSTYVPYFWEEFLEGFADEEYDDDDKHVLSFNVGETDKSIFPELKRKKKVRLVEDDQGFVWEY